MKLNQSVHESISIPFRFLVMSLCGITALDLCHNEYQSYVYKDYLQSIE